MQRLDLTLPTPAENLALDEALLDWAEEDTSDREFLRIWESPQPMVVVGRSSRIAQEVNTAECRERHIPIVRRSSGGAAIVAGPGCLMYARRTQLPSAARAKRYPPRPCVRAGPAANSPIIEAASRSTRWTSDL